MHWLVKLPFIVALPLLFISVSWRFLATSEWFYERGFDTYDVSRTTGLERAELVKGGKALIAYFDSTEEPIAIEVQKDGKSFRLFNEREVVHLKDTKDLFRSVYRVGEIAGLYVLAYVLVMAATLRRRNLERVATAFFQGSVLALAVVVSLGIGALIDFQSLFVEGHVLSFSNDLWMLDPSRDYLIMMFPSGFWFDAAFAVMIITGALAVVTGGAAHVYLGKRQRNVAAGIGMAPY